MTSMTPRPDRRPIRFGLQVSPRPEEIATIGAEAEAAGFDVLSVADHVGPGSLAPLPLLTALAGATSTIGLGTLVLNNDMRNPVQVAWEALSVHRLSGGRVELGLGAGHSPHEYAETGIAFDRPVVRKQRLAESVEIIGALFRGETIAVDGTHYQVDGASLAGTTDATDATDATDPPRLLVGGNGTALLTHAANHADIVGLQGLGRTMADGHRHRVRFGVDHLEAQLETIEAALEPATAWPELNALVQAVELTDDRQAAAAAVVDRIEGLSLAEALATPYLAFGTTEELAAHFLGVRDRWGISYFTVRTPELGPVISRVRQLDQSRQ